MEKMELSFVLPTYNEKENLSVLIPQIEDKFSGLNFEIVIVDDGSKDGTDELVQGLSSRYGNVKIVKRPSLMGIGSALRDGYNTSLGEYILSTDADLSFMVEDMLRLYEKIKEGHDLVLGYKVKYKPVGKDDPEQRMRGARFKYMVSVMGNLTVMVVSRIKLKNFNTNFRILRRDKWQEIKTYEDRNFFNFETILKFRRKGFKIAEIPVLFYERKFGSSKLRFLRESPRYFKKLIWYVFFDKES